MVGCAVSVRLEALDMEGVTPASNHEELWEGRLLVWAGLVGADVLQPVVVSAEVCVDAVAAHAGQQRGRETRRRTVAQEAEDGPVAKEHLVPRRNSQLLVQPCELLLPGRECKHMGSEALQSDATSIRCT